MDLRLATSQLIIAFENTREFHELREANTKIQKNSDYAKKLSDLKKTQNMLYKKQLSELEEGRILQELNATLATLSNIPEFLRYFNAAEKFSMLIAQVIEDINKNVDSRL